MITKIPAIRTNNNKLPCFGQVEVEEKSVVLPYLSSNSTEGDFRHAIHLLDQFNKAKNTFKGEINILHSNEIDIRITGLGLKDTPGGTGFISYVSDKKTGIAHMFVDKFDAFDISLFAPTEPPKPFNVVYKAIENAFRVLNKRK